METKKVTAAILIEDKKILIAKRRLVDNLGGLWELPGGKIENNETVQECLQREMLEEFQITVTIGDYFTQSTYKYPHGEFKILAYEVFWENGEINPQVHDEILWVKIGQLKDFEFVAADRPIINEIIKEKL